MTPSSNKHAVIKMGRYHFYDKSPNDYCFMDEDHDLNTDWWVQLWLVQFLVQSGGVSYRNLLTPLWWMMIPFLTSTHQDHKGGVTFSIFLLPNVMTKYPPPTQIWLHTPPTSIQNLIVQFALFDYGERLLCHNSTWHVWSHEVHPHVELFILHFTFCFA
jgi:hypothetical protein